MDTNFFKVSFIFSSNNPSAIVGGNVLPKKVKNFDPFGISLTILIMASNFSGENLFP